MPQKVRLIDIADRLGLTKVSVSKALRDHGDISEETRELVKRTAAEMGYTPNLLARSLSSQRSHTLGVVVPKIAHTFFSSVIEAVQEEATARGYGIVLAVSSERAGLERQHIERLLSMRVDGLLVSVSKEAPDLEIYDRVRQMGVPLVFFDRQIEGLGFGSVTVDDRAGARRAVEHLIGLGHDEIVHVAGTPEVAIGRDRRAGYEDALRAHELPVREALIVSGGFDERFGARAMRELLDRGDPPSAIFTVTQPVGLGVYGVLAEAGLASDVTLASFGDDASSVHLRIADAIVRQPTGEIGRRALGLLLDQVEGGGLLAIGAEPHEVLEVDLITSTTPA
ncbi:LacI family DNA-binding transcriptional regulator [Rubrivirga marina]|uniref:LacI family transcriptional regulator n=1 Tax=Rubrivirga marina TaxID=1196024 RepID=A0A271IXZ3_9BACT|nr:LacI family DNA-binding transcriptional regulator [Rubrivirga marina]PAP75389.1 LacI family transcriptional regulator [Rubrivirga marina]